MRVGPASDNNQQRRGDTMAGQHRARGPAAVQGRITHSLRRRQKSQGPDHSPVNPFVKYFLFGINFLFMLVGIAFTATAIYILSQKSKKVTSFIDFIFDPACDLCLAGLIILVIAFFGCGGALRESTRFLFIYRVLLGIFLLLELVLVIFVFIFYFVDGAFASIGLYPEDAFADAVRNYRDDSDMQGFIDNIQELLSCCGTSNNDEGYKDWNKNRYFNCTTANKSPDACSVPFSCCKMIEGDNINYRCGAGVLNKSLNLTNIHVEGCLKGLQNLIKNNVWIVGGVILGIIIPQAIFICCANALASQIFEQMSKW